MRSELQWLWKYILDTRRVFSTYTHMPLVLLVQCPGSMLRFRGVGFRDFRKVEGGPIYVYIYIYICMYILDLSPKSPFRSSTFTAYV